MDTSRNAKPNTRKRADPSGIADSETPRMERRAFPRVEMAASARVEGSNGGIGTCKLLNLSRGGAAVALDGINGIKVFPEGHIRPDERVVLCFALPDTADSGAEIDAGCRVIWSRKVSDDFYLVGLEFEAFQEDAAERIEQYIVGCMRFE